MFDKICDFNMTIDLRRRIVYNEYNKLKNLELYGISAYTTTEGKLPLDTPCPICGTSPFNPNDGEHLVIHHWGPGSKKQAIKAGRCRRICGRCNTYLGQQLAGLLYKKEMTWKTQLDVLFERCRRDYRNFPNFREEEGSWSIVVGPETVEVDFNAERRDRYTRVEKILNKAMKSVQRNLDDGWIKVNILNGLIDAKEQLDSDGKESHGG